MHKPCPRTLLICVVAVTSLLTAACGNSDSDSAEGNPNRNTASTVDNEGGGSKSDDSSANKEFCAEYGRLMRIMIEEEGDVREKAETDFAAFLRTAPPDFKGWADDIIPWADAVLTGDSDQINATVEASEDAEYELSNKCQFVMADMDG